VVAIDKPLPVYMLNTQRDFRCRHSGACCTFGWHIPVEPASYASVAEALRAGHMRLPGGGSGDRDADWIDTRQPPAGAVGVLRTRADGACVCFDPDGGRLCGIQRALGHDALPSACQQFPRISLLDDRGAHVTLSHHCPTAAGMLLEHSGLAVEVVRLAADDPVRREAEGFEARGAVPPFLRPGVAFDMAAYDAWERGLVRALGRPDADADGTLAAIAVAAEQLRSWTPSRGSLEADVALVLGTKASRDGNRGRPPGRTATTQLFEDVASSVPDGLARPVLPPDWEAADEAWVAPVWRALSGPVGRFLAAKAFASSIPWQGDDVRTHIMGLAAARAVLRVETARRAGTAQRVCDAATIVDAACAADALFEHLSNRTALVRRWASVGMLRSDAFLAALGLEYPS
jgi:hypothetical protein